MLLSITFTFVLLPSLANCLVCKLGFVVKQTPYPDKLPIGNQTTIEKCPGSHDKSGEACVAVETTAMIGGILFAGNGFECAHSQKCPNIYKECAQIARAAMGGLLDSSPIKTCKIDCCYTDQCNSALLKHWMTDPVTSKSQLTTPSGSVSQEGGSTTATVNIQTNSEKEHKDSIKLVNIVSKSVSRVSTSPASEKTDLSHSATKSSPSHQSLELSSETSSPEERTLTNGPKDNLTYSQTVVSPTAARVNHTSQNALLSALGHERAATMRNSSSITRSARLLLLLFLLYWSYKYVL